MSRDIKVRACCKNIKTGKLKMFKPFYLSWLTIKGTAPEDFTAAQDANWDKNTIFLQYTGLKDENGKEIYEGDIVKASIYSDETPQILEVEYRGSGFLIDYEDSETDCVLLSEFPSSVEIIGNIYENPELLEA